MSAGQRTNARSTTEWSRTVRRCQVAGWFLFVMGVMMIIIALPSLVVRAQLGYGTVNVANIILAVSLLVGAALCWLCASYIKRNK